MIIGILLVSGSYYRVGEEVNGRVVAEIKERSQEWENGIDWIYEVLDQDGHTIVDIQNVGAEVFHAKARGESHE